MTDNKSEVEPIDPMKPYKGRFESHPEIPDKGRSKDDILKNLSIMAEEENTKWQSGQVSGTFYHAGEEHRKFLNTVFPLFSHEDGASMPCSCHQPCIFVLPYPRRIPITCQVVS